MEEFHYEQDVLCCENVRLHDVAERFGTPLYVYSKRSIRDHCRWIENSFGALDHLSTYAVKANTNHDVLRILAAEGIGADVGSLGELRCAIDAGFPSAKITFSGVGKRDDEIEFALRQDILALNVESKEEVEIIHEIAQRINVRARILLRVNFDLKTDTHPYITTGRKHNKFGVERSQALSILTWASALPGVQVCGVHSHIGSQIVEPKTFVDAARVLVQFVDEVRHAGVPVEQINFGGGFGVQYRDYLAHPMLPKEIDNPESDVTTVKLLHAVVPILREAGCKVIIQPGRSIVAHAGMLLTRVLYTKVSEEKTFVIVDAGMNDLIRPSLYQSYHQIVPLKIERRPYRVVDVVGPLCESADFFAIDRSLQEVKRGEYLAVACAGAYGYVLASNYNGRPRPAEVMIEGDSSSVITPRESMDQLLATRSV